MIEFPKNETIETELQKWATGNNISGYKFIDEVKYNLVSKLIERLTIDIKTSLTKKEEKKKNRIYEYLKIQSLLKENSKNNFGNQGYLFLDILESRKICNTITDSTLRYIFFNLSSKMLIKNKIYYNLYKTLERGYWLGTINQQSFGFDEIRIKLNIINTLTSKDHFLKRLYSKYANTDKKNPIILLHKDIIYLKIQLLEKILNILKNELLLLQQENYLNYISAKKLEIYDNEKIILNLKKEANQKSNFSLEPIKFNEIQNISKESIKNLIKKIDYPKKNENSFILLASSDAQNQKSFKANVISENEYKKQHFRIRLGFLYFLQ